jgi:chaperonin GroES
MMDEMPLQDTKTEVDEPKIMGTNLATGLTEEELTDIGQECLRGFQLDQQSRRDWEDEVDNWISLAKQIKEEKTYPWPKASNVKYPLLSTAAMQFSARAYPSLIPSDGKVVKGKVIGKDPTGDKQLKADRVATYMSYQIMHKMRGWEEEMDKMLIMLPVIGTMFKKTWFDKAADEIKSKVILPKNLVVNYWATDLCNVERISEVIEMSPRILKERQLQEIFLEVDLGEPPLPAQLNAPTLTVNDDTTPYTIIEQHTFLDLDKDDYPEPVIVTFHKETGKVLRISARYNMDDIEFNDEGDIIKIEPVQMYTKFGFVPNPDGSFYDIGFGVLLGPINESVNTVINQLIDAGSLSNMQSGFIGKGLRLKMGEAKFGPGEWKVVNAGGEDLAKQIVPLPLKEPSNVLFELMGSLITSGKELASVAEIFVGKMPGQNTPATTTMASIEQGMKVFTAVYKRIYRALESEFKKIYELNGHYLDPQTYEAVLDAPIGPEDFNDDSYDICPGADPTAVSQTERLLKAQGLLELLPLIPGLLNPIEVVSRVLEAQEQPNWQKVFSQEVQASGQLPPPQPDPKLMAIQAKVEADQRKAAVDIQKKQMEMELDGRDKMMQMQMKQQEHAQKMQMEQERTMQKASSEIAMANVYASTERMKGQQSLQQSDQQHQQKMMQNKEMVKSKESQASNGKTGSGTQSQKRSSKK